MVVEQSAAVVVVEGLSLMGKIWRRTKQEREDKEEPLDELGVNRSCAWQLALSGHRPWYYSDHTALAQALTNAYLHEELRLVSIRDLWCRFHYSS